MQYLPILLIIVTVLVVQYTSLLIALRVVSSQKKTLQCMVITLLHTIIETIVLVGFALLFLSSWDHGAKVLPYATIILPCTLPLLTALFTLVISFVAKLPFLKSFAVYMLTKAIATGLLGGLALLCHLVHQNFGLKTPW